MNFSQYLLLSVMLKISIGELNTMRLKRDSFYADHPGPYSPGGFSPDGEMRAPILLELRRDLTPANGPGGICGICTRIYRVLYDTSLSASEECRRYESRQSVLGDITEFYHTLIESRQFNQTLEFPLADRINRFPFRASFMYLESKRNDPAVLIEAVTQNTHVLCVQSIKCPEPETTTPVPITPGVIPPSKLKEDADTQTLNSPQETGEVITGADSKPVEPFWDTLLAGTEEKSWFLATVSLACLSFLLFILFIVSWLYICRMRRLHARRRCRGTCRFGCRCPIEVIRQTVNDAAVFGPLDSQNTQLFASPMTPHGNGSIRSGSGFGPALFPGGTMTSSRWGSNGGTKMGSPIYVSLANASEKTGLIGQTANCIVGPIGTMNPASGGLDGMNGIGTWGQPHNHRQPGNINRRRLSQDVICRTTSDGSSISGHPGSKILGINHLRSGLTLGPGYIGSCSSSTNNHDVMPTSLLAPIFSSPGQQTSDTITYHPLPQANYTLSDFHSNEDAIDPSSAQSPQPVGIRKSNEQIYYGRSLNLSSGSPGPVQEEEEPRNTSSFFHRDKYFGSPENHPMTGPCTTFNSYAPDSTPQTNHYPLRESDGDVLNITPPSGFYDPNGSAVDSGMVNGSLTSSSMRSTNQNGPNSFVSRSHLPPHTSILNSPIGRNGWKTGPLTSVANPASSDMVGVVEVESLISHPTTNNLDGRIDKPAEQTTSKNDTTGLARNQVPSQRIYTGYERML